jgi:translation initiation factor 2B subunit (eIF-2B alpha/beta/delta family)
MEHLSDHIRQLLRPHFSLHESTRFAKRSLRQGLASIGGWESRRQSSAKAVTGECFARNKDGT